MPKLAKAQGKSKANKDQGNGRQGNDPVATTRS